MSCSCIRFSKICFLLSVIFCVVLLLLIPKFQADWRPRSYPQPRPPSVFNASNKSEVQPQQAESSSVGHLNDETNNIVPFVKEELIREWRLHLIDTGRSSLKANRKRNESPNSPWSVGVDHVGPDIVSAKEKLELKDIFIAVKTTRKYHKTRLNLLFQTWISQARGQETKNILLHGILIECNIGLDPVCFFSGARRERGPADSPKGCDKSCRAYVGRDKSSKIGPPLSCASGKGVGANPLVLFRNLPEIKYFFSCLPQTFIFTDWEDQELRHRAGDHMINTNCSAVHTRQALCCKMSVEYDKFLESGQKWFCHVDDDNYVNLQNLLHLLSAFSHNQDVYVGRPSLDHPIEAVDHVRNDGSTTVKFWFATGGAGFCISRGLALKMSPWASLGSFISTADRIRLPDDCTVGYIIEGLLEVKMHHSPLFHSHLENLQRLRGEMVFKQVTLSYGGPENRHNVVSVGEMFSVQQDPTRFRSVHCVLYPDTAWCPTATMK